MEIINEPKELDSDIYFKLRDARCYQDYRCYLLLLELHDYVDPDWQETIWQLIREREEANDELMDYLLSGEK